MMRRGGLVKPKMLGRNLSDPHHAADRACAGMSTEVFFPDTATEAADAEEICAQCPQLTRCAAWALRAGVTDGVFASVWVPDLGASTQDKNTARAHLALVAATGLPHFELSQEVA
ncbi:WhiB family transcriptional regulator [Nocardia tengchongensis]|uniref:WhiB family transcriptional regulator n=1 Tax=Nocardia tengchongensis TaxID=2055889 RepID=UPI0036B77B93